MLDSVFLAPRRCLLEPIPEIWAAARLLREAVDAHLSGDTHRAEALISEANVPAIAKWTDSIWSHRSQDVHRFRSAPNWLLYVTGGLAVTHVNDSVACTGTCGSFATGTVTWSESSTLTGGTIGGGLEAMFGPNWSARVEYLYAKFKDTTPPATSVPSLGLTVPPLFSFHHDLNVVRFAINYKFGP